MPQRNCRATASALVWSRSNGEWHQKDQKALTSRFGSAPVRQRYIYPDKKSLDWHLCQKQNLRLTAWQCIGIGLVEMVTISSTLRTRTRGVFSDVSWLIFICSSWYRDCLEMTGQMVMSPIWSAHLPYFMHRAQNCAYLIGVRVL